MTTVPEKGGPEGGGPGEGGRAPLTPVTHKIVLEDLCFPVDIGFLATEIGQPQRLTIGVEVWLEPPAFPRDDRVAAAWDYDQIYRAIAAILGARRFNLQETVARAIFDDIAARPGVTGVRVTTRKPDIYHNCAGVGVDLVSF